MKIIKTIAAAGLLAAALAVTTGTALAAEWQTPAEAVAGVTGKSAQEVAELREEGLSCGAIAAGAGKLEEFQEAMLALREERLEARVADGQLTQEQADSLLEAMKERQALCDGTGAGLGNSVGNGCCDGTGAGLGNGVGNGRCDGTGAGLGNGVGNGRCDGTGAGLGNGRMGGGQGNGHRLRDGSCLS